MRFINTPNYTAPIQTGKEMPTEKEQKLIEVLRKVPYTSVYGFSIARALASNDRNIFQQLIGELRDQCTDCPKEMKKLIGEEAFKMIKDL